MGLHSRNGFLVITLDRIMNEKNGLFRDVSLPSRESLTFPPEQLTQMYTPVVLAHFQATA